MTADPRSAQKGLAVVTAYRQGYVRSLPSRCALLRQDPEACRSSQLSFDAALSPSGLIRPVTSNRSAHHLPSCHAGGDTCCTYYLKFRGPEQGGFLHYIRFSKTKDCFHSVFSNHCGQIWARTWASCGRWANRSTYQLINVFSVCAQILPLPLFLQPGRHIHRYRNRCRACPLCKAFSEPASSRCSQSLQPFQSV